MSGVRLHRRQCPAVGRELACDGDRDDRAALTATLERVPALVQPPRAVVGTGSHGSGLACAAPLERGAPTQRRPLMPGRLDEQTAGVAVAGLADRAQAPLLTAGALARS